MARYEDKFYYVDPGIGSKKDGCPYSFFKDGQDVIDFIIPPEGYVFKSFRFEPYDEDPCYEGKIVAEYEVGEIKKEPLLKPYQWVLLVVAAILFMLFTAYCAKHVIKKLRKRARKTVIDLTIPDTTKIDTTTTDTTSFKGVIVAETEQQTSPIVQQEVQSKPIEKEKEKEKNTGETLTQFQENFWSLVHQRTATMDDFYNLFVKYKKRVKCEEYDYLRLVILQNFATFREWNRQMLLIPPDELQSINDIPTLQERIDIKI